jgi:thiol:disulfide interchange protein DsbD
MTFKQALSVTVLSCCLGILGVANAGITDALNKLGSAGNLLGGGAEFLDPEQAFRFNYVLAANDTVQISWDIEEGYYLYRDKITAKSLSEPITLGELARPAGIMKDDPDFGRVAIYKHELALPLTFEQRPEGPTTATIEVGYQGCAEDGICYPPIKKQISVALNQLISPVSAAAAQMLDPPLTSSPAILSADDIAARLSSRSLIAIAGSFYIFGLLLAFTPCVFPMVPILSGIIVGQRQPVSFKKGLTLSMVYVLAVAVTYAVVGLLAGMFGHNLQASFQQPLVLISFSLVFVALAMSMFGFYELQLPAGLQTRLDGLSRSQNNGYAGVAVMGVLSAIIVGPCVAPPLAGALIYLSHQGSPLVGGTALFALGLGMGTPLLLVGASAGKFLPRAGAWMDIVKRIFGIMLLGVAIWFMERILPGPLVLFLWAALIIVSAIFVGALDPLVADDSGWRRLYKGLGLVMLAYGAVLIVGASAGATDPLRPLKPLVAKTHSASQGLSFVAVKGPDGLSAGLRAAQAQGRPAMLDFYADWCVECKYLERDTFEHPDVQAALKNVVLLRADVTANDPEDQMLLQQLELYGPPAVLFFGIDGSEFRDRRILGFLGPEDFTAHVNNLP